MYNYSLSPADTATQLGSVSDVDDVRDTQSVSPKPATKSVSWAASLTSSTESSDQQEIVALRQELKQTMRNNIE